MKTKTNLSIMKITALPFLALPLVVCARLFTGGPLTEGQIAGILYFAFISAGSGALFIWHAYFMQMQEKEAAEKKQKEKEERKKEERKKAIIERLMGEFSDEECREIATKIKEGEIVLCLIFEDPHYIVAPIEPNEKKNGEHHYFPSDKKEVKSFLSREKIVNKRLAEGLLKAIEIN